MLPLTALRWVAAGPGLGLELLVLVSIRAGLAWLGLRQLEVIIRMAVALSTAQDRSRSLELSCMCGVREQPKAMQRPFATQVSDHTISTRVAAWLTDRMTWSIIQALDTGADWRMPGT